MFSSSKSSPHSRDVLLERAKLERESRNLDKQKHSSAVVIQKYMRNWYGRQHELKLLRKEIDATLERLSFTGLELYKTGQQLLFVFSAKKDRERFKKCCQLLVSSMEQPTAKAWYVSVAIQPKWSASWMVQLKKVLVLALGQLQGLQFGLPVSDALIKLYLELIALFTDHTLWKFTKKVGPQVEPMLKGICNNVMEHLLENGFYSLMHELLLNSLTPPAPTIPGHFMSTVMGIRQLALCNFSPKMILPFTTSILTVPGSLLQLKNLSAETLSKLNQVDFLSKLVAVLHPQSSILKDLDANDSLSVFGNLLYLSSIHVTSLSNRDTLSSLLDILAHLIRQCSSGPSSHRSAATSWHPFFGWIAANTDKRVMSMMGLVREQLQHLWCGHLVQCFFSPVLNLTPAQALPSAKSKMRFSLFKKTSESIKPDHAILKQASQVCHLYDTCFQSLKGDVKTDILIGLGCHGTLVSKMWHFLWLTLKLDVDKIVQAAAAVVAAKGSAVKPGSVACEEMSTQHESASMFGLLNMCCQTTQYCLVTLDDDELFNDRTQFSTSELVEISSFLNHLVFQLIMEGLSSVSFFTHAHALLVFLHTRDCRRPFTEPNRWLMKNLKISNFMHELKAGKPRAKKLLEAIPHVLLLKKRLEIFQDRVTEEKRALGISRSHSSSGERTTSAYIDIRRNRILEDGYTQLSYLAPKSLKGTIRVKFINEQGLDEAGIDETGVFKEFLEEVIKSAFNPDLNLFKSNSQSHLYPSPTSYVLDNHLALFEFIGKMLGKALYEGIVVDVPLAPFFLSQMLEHHFSACYSSLDELPSMDKEMHKSLSYIKHTEDDVSDLCLTFSWDENFLGKVTSHELVPGGRVVQVTNENRINYVHRMAHFRMYTQIKKQSAAFIKGFHSVIDKSWVSCFSPHELQHLISGNQGEIDIDDLRKHTQYYGGYHDNHKVVAWLWDILKNEFSAQEKATFLKFVTSCSKSPLLGFNHMEPPFSIRCVEVPDEEDSGDSAFSMLKGLFSIRRRGAQERLPTASTCFNLLKLPNYTRKAILKEKLRYALSANAGFELS